MALLRPVDERSPSPLTGRSISCGPEIGEEKTLSFSSSLSIAATDSLPAVLSKELRGVLFRVRVHLVCDDHGTVLCSGRN